MELRQLRAFYTISQLKNFTQAAARLGYTQPTITAQIQLLEEELGVKLFSRRGRQLSLTPDGERLEPYAAAILRLTAEATAQFSREPQGRLLVGAGDWLAVTRLAALWQQYRSRYPQVELVIKNGSSQDFLAALKNGSLDIAFLLGPAETQPGCHCRPLFVEPAVCLVSPTHPLAALQALTPPALQAQTLLLSERGCHYRTHVEQVLKDYAIQPAAITETSSFSLMKQFALQGLGVAFLPQFAAEAELAAGELRPLPWQGPPFPNLVQVCYAQDTWLSPALQALLQAVDEQFPAG